MNVLKISLRKLILRHVDQVRFSLSVLCIFLLTLFAASKLAAEPEGKPAQGPVSLTELVNFDALEEDVPQADETPAVVDPGISAQDAADRQINDAQPDISVPAGGEGAPLASVATGRVGRRSVSKVGLASIGLHQITPTDSVINSLIW